VLRNTGATARLLVQERIEGVARLAGPTAVDAVAAERAALADALGQAVRLVTRFS
jgi:hypothetical protein